MAVKIIEKSNPLRAALEKVLPVFGINSGIVVNAEEVKAGFDPDKETERPIIFYSMESYIKLTLDGHPAAKYFWRSDCGCWNLLGPGFSVVNLLSLFEKIEKGEKIENKAAILVSEVGSQRNEAGIILHDIAPGKSGVAVEKALQKARDEFDLEGEAEEIREKLESMRRNSSKAIASLIGEEIIPGVFCDVEGTLLRANGEVNAEALEMLQKYSKTKAVTIWTGGNAESYQRKFLDLGIDFPVLSKYNFSGCSVEIVIDDMGKEAFENDYQIKVVEKFIQIERRM